MNSLKQLVTARWFPTVTKPILSGLLASGIIIALRALGVTDIVPAEVNAAVAPLVGFLIAAIVQTGGGTTTVATVNAQVTPAIHTNYKPGETLGKTIAHTFLEDIAQEIDADPSLLKSLGAQALERVLNPVQTVNTTSPSPEVLSKLIGSTASPEVTVSLPNGRALADAITPSAQPAHLPQT